MQYININQIYDYYKKELTSWSLLNAKEKSLIIIPTILALFTVFFFCEAFIKKSVKLFICVLILYALMLLSIFFIYRLFARRFRAQNKYVNYSYSDKACFTDYRTKKLIPYLKSECGIQTKEQKELLIEMLKERSEKRYNSRGLLIVAILCALLLPLWNVYVDKTIDLHIGEYLYYLSTFAVLAFIIAVYIWFIHFTTIDTFISVLNRQSDTFKQIINIMRQDLMFNHYHKDLPENNNNNSVKKKK